MSTFTNAPPRLNFDLSSGTEAHEPPEARGKSRADVRMLVTSTRAGSLEDSCFRALPTFLEEGDLLVVNVSRTIPGELDATTVDGDAFVVRLSTQLDDVSWVVEPRTAQGAGAKRWSGPLPARHAWLRAGGSIRFEQPYEGSTRLWRATLDLPDPLLVFLAKHGRPIRYDYVERPWPLAIYQNVYGIEPGSAEMPSAGRPFTEQMLTMLLAHGIGITPITLHTGVASLGADELPYPERVRVPQSSAERVNLARAHDHRVIAVGTTVVRALESAASTHGLVSSYDGWTDLVISPARELRVVDGLLTGWHEPESSHLLMLERFLGRELLARAYDKALRGRYRWHEFGDLHLALP